MSNTVTAKYQYQYQVIIPYYHKLKKEWDTLNYCPEQWFSNREELLKHIAAEMKENGTSQYNIGPVFVRREREVNDSKEADNKRT